MIVFIGFWSNRTENSWFSAHARLRASIVTATMLRVVPKATVPAAATIFTARIYLRLTYRQLPIRPTLRLYKFTLRSVQRSASTLYGWIVK